MRLGTFAALFPTGFLDRHSKVPLASAETCQSGASTRASAASGHVGFGGQGEGLAPRRAWTNAQSARSPAQALVCEQSLAHNCPGPPVHERNQ